MNIKFYNFTVGLSKFLVKTWFRGKVLGSENIPCTGSTILICNHKSIFDVFCICTITKRPLQFMAKKELFEKKLSNKIFSALGAFPVDRGTADIAAIRKALGILKKQEVLAVFPEGTRNKVQTSPLLPLQEGVAMMALRGKACIVPMWLEGGFNPFKPMTMFAGKPLDLSAYEGILKPDNAVIEAVTEQMKQALLVCRQKAIQSRQK